MTHNYVNNFTDWFSWATVSLYWVSADWVSIGMDACACDFLTTSHDLAAHQREHDPSKIQGPYGAIQGLVLPPRQFTR